MDKNEDEFNFIGGTEENERIGSNQDISLEDASVNINGLKLNWQKVIALHTTPTHYDWRFCSKNSSKTSKTSVIKPKVGLIGIVQLRSGRKVSTICCNYKKDKRGFLITALDSEFWNAYHGYYQDEYQLAFFSVGMKVGMNDVVTVIDIPKAENSKNKNCLGCQTFIQK